ncbi:nucleotidyltransferase domain-containing protein [Sulfurifustis variabilis]|uniref:nucleotidyltransferase domain-containing protein n=1 Tax=Sulfurifustis variabilis TaxID=1675686 RepID=UPI0018D52DAD|nr:nucleotidyltransferase domain-containing protein [Sulfurifustis variabilis]
MIRLAGGGSGAVQRELARLVDSGLDRHPRWSPEKHYQANPKSPLFRELCGIARKTVGLADVLREALTPLASEIDLAFVFGSVAQGKERVTSDVDVFVVGSVSFTYVVKAVAPTHERLGREINPVVMPRSDFLRKQKEGDRFVARVIREPKLFLIGTADDLGELVKDRADKSLTRRSRDAAGRGPTEPGRLSRKAGQRRIPFRCRLQGDHANRRRGPDGQWLSARHQPAGASHDLSAGIANDDRVVR